MEITKEMEEKIRQDALDKIELGITAHGMNMCDILTYLLTEFAKEMLEEYGKD